MSDPPVRQDGGARRPIADADQFFARGRSLLGAVVPIDVVGGRQVRYRLNGVRITPTLVLTIDAAAVDARFRVLDDPGATTAIGGATTNRLWSSPGGAALLQTAPYDGALPELSLGTVAGHVTVAFFAFDGPLCVGFGSASDGELHDAPVGFGAIGAPIFDDAWSLVGLHRRARGRGGELTATSALLRMLEASPHWDEIASTHRLVRSAVPAAAPPESTIASLERAVRWDPDDDQPLSGRDRRAALRGASLEALRRARGNAPAAGPEQRAVDAILVGPPFDAAQLDQLAVDELLAFATASRWFDGVVPGLPDAVALERVIHRRRRIAALAAIVGPHFAPRSAPLERLQDWLGQPRRPPLMVRGPGGIGKSALLARLIQQVCPPLRYAWLDFDRPDLSVDAATIQRAVDEDLAWQPGTGTLLVVLDSFETAVQTYGHAQLGPALDALARQHPDLAVVVASRAPVPLLRVEGQPAQDYELGGLDTGAAVQWLIEEQIPPSIAAATAEVVCGVPLNLRLARDLLAGKSEPEAREALADLPRQLVTGYLYRRILRRLSDDTLRRHSQWAMVPRRLVPELLAAIFGVSGTEAERLFAALRREVTLLEGDAVLAIRADLRTTLLPLLESEDPGRVRRIDQIAAEFWARRAGDDIAAAAEAIYHHLRLSHVDAAGRLWRTGVEVHLRGYTLEELPPESRAWLQRGVAEQRRYLDIGDVLSHGQVAAARDILSPLPEQVHAPSHAARSHALRRLVDDDPAESITVDLGSILDRAELKSLESSVLARKRPTWRILDGGFEPPGAPWEFLARGERRDRVLAAITAVGQLRRLPDERLLGTAALVGRDVVLTTRSAAASFVVGIGAAVSLVPDRRVVIDLRVENGGSIERYAVDRAVLVHPHWDIALLRVAGEPGAHGHRQPLALATAEPDLHSVIVAIGHPGQVAPELAHLQAAIYGDVIDVKRVMPGLYVGSRPELSFGHEVVAGRDDASTLSADPGAAVIDVQTGALVGVRFTTEYLQGNSFVPAWELTRDDHVRAALDLAGTSPPRAWMSAWSTGPAVRELLLDAYVARREGDLVRAAAIFDIVPARMAAPHHVDRAILEAACYLRMDRSRAGSILEDLVAQGPGLTDGEIDALVATRLRIAVDAQAERTFLSLSRKHREVVRLLTPNSFRVIAADLEFYRARSGATSAKGMWPANTSFWETPWGADAGAFRDGLGFPKTLREFEAVHPRAAIRAAERILRADAECKRLEPWAETNGRRIMALDFPGTSGDHARALAAALVGLRTESVHRANEFLLVMLDLGPHPARGWQPVLSPLRALLASSWTARASRDAPSFSSNEALAKWLEDNVRSGGLGSHLQHLIRVDSSVAWAVGLLHLLTPLPIEALLERRFTRLAGAVT